MPLQERVKPSSLSNVVGEWQSLLNQYDERAKQFASTPTTLPEIVEYARQSLRDAGGETVVDRANRLAAASLQSSPSTAAILAGELAMLMRRHEAAPDDHSPKAQQGGRQSSRVSNEHSAAVSAQASALFTRASLESPAKRPRQQSLEDTDLRASTSEQVPVARQRIAHRIDAPASNRNYTESSTHPSNRQWAVIDERLGQPLPRRLPQSSPSDLLRQFRRSLVVSSTLPPVLAPGVASHEAEPVHAAKRSGLLETARRSLRRSTIATVPQNRRGSDVFEEIEKLADRGREAMRRCEPARQMLTAELAAIALRSFSRSPVSVLPNSDTALQSGLGGGVIFPNA